VTTQDTAAHHKDLVGNKAFSWFTPAKRKATEYENYTVGQYSSPDQWLDVDWVIRFSDGRPPWSDDFSKVKTSEWREYRDPDQVWQRPFVGTTNQDQQSLDRLVPVLVKQSGPGTDPVWAAEVLSRTYAAWPFVEYGLFLALAYAVRQAMSDTVQFSTVFQAVDRLRLLQDIVQHLDQLTTQTGLNDDGAREAWMTDPTLVPIRELVEHICASEDWVEILVVATLVFDPIVGRLAKSELFGRRAPLSGDSATPLVMAGAVRDNERHVRAVQALVQLVCADAVHGPANLDVVSDWIAAWQPRCEAAAVAFLPAMAAVGEDEAGCAAALSRVLAHQQAVVEGAGVKV